MTRKLLPLVLLFFGLSFYVSGQDIHFSQFFNSPLTLNPAQTGNFDGSYRAGLIYRDQWSSVNSPYKTFSGSFDMTFPVGFTPGDAVSGGIMLFSDKAGDGNFATTSVMLSGAYHKSLGIGKRLTLGVQAGMLQRKLDFDQYYFADQFDGTGFTSMNTNEKLAVTNFSNIDLNIGLQYDGLISEDFKLSVGAAALHLISPKESFFNNKNIKLPMLIVGNAEANIRLNEKMTLNPRIVYRAQKKAQEFSLGTDLGYYLTNGDFEATLYGGLWYRATGNDAIIPYVAMEYKGFKLGLSYDVNISTLSEASRGAGGFEISLMFIGRIKPSPVTVVVPCLRF
jgi:type IX secretion system PorP/SprF family membrane protein